MYLVTHDGQAHADDLCAYSVLSTVHKDHRLVRTREKEKINRPDSIVFDVGMIYDATIGRFDHHQTDKPMRNDGVGYSSFGLIWKHFGKDYLYLIGISMPLVDLVWKNIDDKFVRMIDIGDTGYDGNETVLVNNDFSFARTVSIGIKETNDFVRVALKFVSPMLKEMCIREAARIEDLNYLEENYLSYDGNGIIVIEKSKMKNPSGAIDFYTGHVDQTVKFIVYPYKEAWSVNTVRDNPNSFKSRKDLVCAGAGMNYEDLIKVPGCEELVFVHSALFFATGTTFESVYELAKKSLL